MEQDAEEVLDRGCRRRGGSAQLARERAEEIAACGLDHQGESVLAWDAETGKPLTPIVTWQDKRSQEMLDRLEADGRAEKVVERSGMPLDPYFSAGKARPGCSSTTTRSRRPRERGTLRLGTVDSFLCDRLGAGFATDPSTASRTQLGAPEWDAELLEIFGVPLEALPEIADTAGDLGTLRHPSWPVELPLRARCVDQQAALAGAGCVDPGPRQGDLRHRRLRPRPRRRASGPSASGGLLPTVAWRVGGQVEWAIDGGVFTAGALLEWLTRDLGLAEDPPALAAAAAEVEDAGGVRVLPALAGTRRALVALRRPRRPRRHDRRDPSRATSAARRSRRSPGGSPTCSPPFASRSPSRRCASTAASRAIRLCSSCRPTAAGIPVERGAVDATAAGAAALAAVGAGIWASTAEIGSASRSASGSSPSSTTRGAGRLTSLARVRRARRGTLRGRRPQIDGVWRAMMRSKSTFAGSVPKARPQSPPSREAQKASATASSP